MDYEVDGVYLIKVWLSGLWVCIHECDQFFGSYEYALLTWNRDFGLRWWNFWKLFDLGLNHILRVISVKFGVIPSWFGLWKNYETT